MRLGAVLAVLLGGLACLAPCDGLSLVDPRAAALMARAQELEALADQGLEEDEDETDKVWYTEEGLFRISVEDPLRDGDWLFFPERDWLFGVGTTLDLTVHDVGVVAGEFDVDVKCGTHASRLQACDKDANVFVPKCRATVLVKQMQFTTDLDLEVRVDGLGTINVTTAYDPRILFTANMVMGTTERPVVMNPRSLQLTYAARETGRPTPNDYEWVLQTKDCGTGDALPGLSPTFTQFRVESVSAMRRSGSRAPDPPENEQHIVDDALHGEEVAPLVEARCSTWSFLDCGKAALGLLSRGVSTAVNVGLATGKLVQRGSSALGRYALQKFFNTALGHKVIQALLESRLKPHLYPINFYVPDSLANGLNPLMRQNANMDTALSTTVRSVDLAEQFEDHIKRLLRDYADRHRPAPTGLAWEVMLDAILEDLPGGDLVIDANGRFTPPVQALDGDGQDGFVTLYAVPEVSRLTLTNMDIRYTGGARPVAEVSGAVDIQLRLDVGAHPHWGITLKRVVLDVHTRLSLHYKVVFADFADSPWYHRYTRPVSSTFGTSSPKLSPTQTAQFEEAVRRYLRATNRCRVVGDDCLAFNVVGFPDFNQVLEVEIVSLNALDPGDGSGSAFQRFVLSSSVSTKVGNWLSGFFTAPFREPAGIGRLLSVGLLTEKETDLRAMTAEQRKQLAHNAPVRQDALAFPNLGTYLDSWNVRTSYANSDSYFSRDTVFKKDFGHQCSLHKLRTKQLNALRKCATVVSPAVANLLPLGNRAAFRQTIPSLVFAGPDLMRHPAARKIAKAALSITDVRVA